MDRGEVNNWVRYVVWVDGNEFENEGVGEGMGGTFELLNVRLPVDVKLSVTVKF